MPYVIKVVEFITLFICLMTIFTICYIPYAWLTMEKERKEILREGFKNNEKVSGAGQNFIANSFKAVWKLFG